MKTLVAFDNIVIYVFNFNLATILCISVLTVTFIKLLLTLAVGHIFQSLVNNQMTHGDWLYAVPMSACGLHLKDETIRVAVVSDCAGLIIASVVFWLTFVVPMHYPVNVIQAAPIATNL